MWFEQIRCNNRGTMAFVEYNLFSTIAVFILSRSYECKIVWINKENLIPTVMLSTSSKFV